MEREIEARRPPANKSEGLSTMAKVFFGLNIFQVIAIGGIQSAMIACGNFKPVSQEGLGPGRRVYMALFLLAVLYSCFLCLFAVKRQNFLEILAFVLQNYAYIIYSGIQVYHISFKEYEAHKIERQTVLIFLTIIDSIGLLVLNIIFTYLANKLFCEYGWKIYKRVRFNIKLRAAFHLYETVLMLLKMQFLFITMFAICLNQTLLYDQVGSFNYIASLASIPVCLVFSIIGIMSIRREMKYVACFFILGVLFAIFYLIFKMASVTSKTCTGCEPKAEVRDIPGEVDMHILYLDTCLSSKESHYFLLYKGSVNLILLVGLLVAFIKAVRNFGIGLAEHFKADMNSKFIVLNLSRNVLTSIVTSTGEERDVSYDMDTPRPGVSNEPRPSVFQYLPRFNGSSDHTLEDADNNKSLSLPAHLQKRDNIAKQLSKSAKRRISQIFWENDLGRYGSHRSSLASGQYSSCFRGCCPLFRGRRTSFSIFNAAEDKCINSDVGQQDEDRFPNNNHSGKTKPCGVRRRKRSRSLGEFISFSSHTYSRRRLARVNSLPIGCMRQSSVDRASAQNFALILQNSVQPSLTDSELTDSGTQAQTTPEIIVTASYDESETGGLLKGGAITNPVFERQGSCEPDVTGSFVKRPPGRPILQRRVQSSIPSLSTSKTNGTETEKEMTHFKRINHSSDKSPHETGQWRTEIEGISHESLGGLRRALSDIDLLKRPGKRGKVHFAY